MANERGLELLVLDRKNITNVGDVERFASFVQNVSELDLAWNQISSWSTVSTLLRTMPSLKMLNLSHNPIDKSPPLIEDDLVSWIARGSIVVAFLALQIGFFVIKDGFLPLYYNM